MIRLASVPRGQVLVIVAAGMFVFIAMVALVIDGGHAWGQNRMTQNGADAAAEAGAVVLVQNLAGKVKTDADVEAAVLASGSDNGVSIEVAYYTDIGGTWLTDTGGTTTDPLAAAQVGGGSIPPCNANCAGGVASGVDAHAARTFDTFFARVMGFDQLTARAEAIAVAGYAPDPCADPDGCVLLPVTVPVTIVTCDGQNDALNTTTPYQKYVHYVVPLCKNSPGNIGWIDWDPPEGGVAELEEEISNPQPRAITIPDWYYINQTGDTNAQPIEDALNVYAGDVVLIPMFDSICMEDPGAGLPPEEDDLPCPPDQVGMTGQSGWYHLNQIGYFQFDYPKGAYITGNDKATCDSGNGATSCFTGQFVDFVYSTTVQVSPPAESATGAFSYGVQLIR